MMKYIRLVLIALMSVLFASVSAYALQDFSVSDNSFSSNLEFDESTSHTLTVENTGDENISLDVSGQNLQSNGDTISLSISPTQIINLTPGTTQNIQINYSSGNNIGNFSGDITVENSNNASQSETISITSTITTGGNVNLTISGVGEPGELIEITGDIDDRETENIRFKNEGDVDLQVQNIIVSDLVGREYDEEIESDDIDIEDTSFDLDAGDSESIEFEFDVPDDIPADIYEGTLRVETNAGDFEWDIEFTAEDDGILDVFIDTVDIEFEDGQFRNRVLEVFVEEGDSVDNIEFVIENDENRDIAGLRLRVEDGELEGESTSNTLPASAFTFSRNDFDVDEDDTEDIELTIDIPDGQAVDTYVGVIELLDSSGDDIDEITIEVNVVGEVFIKDITFDKESYKPGELVNVDVIIQNQGSKTYRDVNVEGIIRDVDFDNSDLTDSTGTILLDPREEKTATLRFRLPQEARNGERTLEIRLEFGSEVEVEFEEINIERPLYNTMIDSHSINPGVIKCKTDLYAYVRVKNLGSLEDEIEVSSEIVGTDLMRSSSTYELGVDETSQENFLFDVSSLEPGTYTVQHIVRGDGDTHDARDTFRIDQCGGTGVDVKPINTSNQTGNQTGVDGGFNLNNSTVYLGAGLGLVIILIIISLFLL